MGGSPFGEVNHHRRLVIGRYDQHFEELLPFQSSPVEFLRSTYDLPEQEARKFLGMFGLDGARHLIKIKVRPLVPKQIPFVHL